MSCSFPPPHFASNFEDKSFEDYLFELFDKLGPLISAQQRFFIFNTCRLEGLEGIYITPLDLTKSRKTLEVKIETRKGIIEMQF